MMKKHFFTFLFSVTSLLCFAQDILKKEPAYPIVGYEKLLNDNPFVLNQDSGLNNTWRDKVKYTWIPSSIQPYKKESKVIKRDTTTWTDLLITKDSFILDNQNRISIAFEDIIYNYPTKKDREISKYSFTYGINNKPDKIVIQQSSDYSSFYSNYELYYFYNSAGQMTRDSSYTFSTQESLVNSYDYNGAGNIVKIATFSSISDTIIANASYDYINNRLHTVYRLELNRGTGKWSEVEKDTFDYDGIGNVVYAARYINTSGPSSVFLPFIIGSYHYNSQNQLDEFVERRWINGTLDWRNESKFTISYTNNKPSSGYIYAIDKASKNWSEIPRGKLLFSIPTGINNIALPTLTDITVSPNPATNNINIFIPFLNKDEEATITLLNNKGENMVVPAIRNQKEISLDTNLLSKGIYVIQVQTNTNVITKKVLIAE